MFLVHISYARYLEEKNFFFFISTREYLKLELILLFEEFHAIITPNNIFTLAQIQIFIFLWKRESRNARLSEMD